jgi:hypothetical protein
MGRNEAEPLPAAGGLGCFRLPLAGGRVGRGCAKQTWMVAVLSEEALEATHRNWHCRMMEARRIS